MRGAVGVVGHAGALAALFTAGLSASSVQHRSPEAFPTFQHMWLSRKERHTRKT